MCTPPTAKGLIHVEVYDVRMRVLADWFYLSTVVHGGLIIRVGLLRVKTM